MEQTTTAQGATQDTAVTNNAQGAQTASAAANDIKLPVIKKSNGQMTMERAEGIYYSRDAFVREQCDDKEIAKLKIQGNGTLMDVVDKGGKPVADRRTGELLTKMVYNVNGICDVSASSPTAKALRRKAKALEQAGDKQQASDYWNAWLNFCQISFNIIVQGNEALVDRLGDGVQIEGELEWIETQFGKKISLASRSVRLRKSVSGRKPTVIRDEDDATAATPAGNSAANAEGGIPADELKNIQA